MQVNTKIRYGLRTMIEIASSPDSKGLLQKDIASSQNISLKYLDPIISALKIKGLISNAKGRGSGYILTRPSEQITMYDIYTAFEQISIIECINNCSLCERTVHDCHAKNYWIEFKDNFEELLKSKNLAQIVEDTYYECNEPRSVEEGIN